MEGKIFQFGQRIILFMQTSEMLSCKTLTFGSFLLHLMVKKFDG